MAPEIRGIAGAKRTLVRESRGSREDPVPREASADELFRRPARPTEQKKTPLSRRLLCLVAPTGFEPATFALRGRRPKPLDDGAMYVVR